MALIPDHRWQPLFRLRSVLRLAGRLPDVADVFPVGPVCLAEPDSQNRLGLLTRPYAPAWIAVRFWRSRPDPDCHLSGVSRYRRRSQRVGLLGRLARASVLDQWTPMVFVATPGVE